MAKGFILTQRDIEAIQRLLDESRRDVVNTQQRAGHKHTVSPHNKSSQTYLALTPTITGIPGMVGRIAGSANCNVYQMVSGVIETSSPGTQLVYNINTQAVPGDTWILITKDAWGYWIVTGSFFQGFTTTTSTTTTTTTTPCTGSCVWQWDPTNNVWRPVVASCTGSESCSCTCPTFCGYYDCQTTITNCANIVGGSPSNCPCTTSTTTTTTTTCICQGSCYYECDAPETGTGGGVWVLSKQNCVCQFIGTLFGSCNCPSLALINSIYAPCEACQTMAVPCVLDCPPNQCCWECTNQQPPWLQTCFCPAGYTCPKSNSDFLSACDQYTIPYQCFDCIPTSTTTTSTTTTSTSSTTSTTCGTTTTPAPGPCGQCTWQWVISGAYWLLQSNSCTGSCGCSYPGYTPCIHAGSIVATTNCVHPGTTTTPTTSTTSTTTTSTTSTTTTSTTTTTTTTSVGCGSCTFTCNVITGCHRGAGEWTIVNNCTGICNCQEEPVFGSTGTIITVPCM